MSIQRWVWSPLGMEPATATSTGMKFVSAERYLAFAAEVRWIVWDAECDCTRGTGEEHSPHCLTVPILAAIDKLKEE